MDDLAQGTRASQPAAFIDLRNVPEQNLSDRFLPLREFVVDFLRVIGKAMRKGPDRFIICNVEGLFRASARPQPMGRLTLVTQAAKLNNAGFSTDAARSTEDPRCRTSSLIRG